MFGICIKLMGITWASVCLFSHIKADRTDRDERQTLSVSLREMKKQRSPHMHTRSYSEPALLTAPTPQVWSKQSLPPEMDSVAQFWSS